MKIRLMNNKTWLAAAMIGLLIFLHLIGVIAPLESWFVAGLNSIGHTFYSWGSQWQDKAESQKNQADLEAELSQTKTEVIELLAEKAQWQQVAQENEQLREYLDFFSQHDYKKVMAKVIARQNLLVAGNSQANLFLDQGSNQGIYPGLGIINAQGVLVGKVTEVKTNSSQACLTINENCKIAATIDNQDRTIGIVNGDLGLTIIMDLIPQNNVINVGDLVITSGLEEEIPAGLLLGKVNEIVQSSNEIWKQAILEPLYVTDKLNTVSVIIPK